MFCWSESSCNERYEDHKYWMSSASWDEEMAQGGIFATDGSSPWGTANRVYVPYCSSDFHSGDVGKSDQTFGFAFRGARIIAAVITDLLNKQGLAAGDELLFGGCSAGAIGAMNNMDAVAAQLPPGITMKGFLDAAALLDIQPTGWSWSNELIPLQTLIQEVTSFIAPVFPSYCQTEFPGEEWKCLIGQYRMPLIKSVPFFMNAPQFDEFELMYDTDNYAPKTQAQYDFVEQFQTGTLALIRSLPAGTGVYSPTCLVHCLSGQSTFQALLVDGTSIDTALSQWYFQGGDVQVVSSCTGWQCVQQCGINANTGLPCNSGAPGCQAIQLATDSSSSSSDAAPAQQVKTQETALTSSQRVSLASLTGRLLLDDTGRHVSTGKRLLAAAPQCCNGRRDAYPY